jgi:hypothetical protein
MGYGQVVPRRRWRFVRAAMDGVLRAGFRASTVDIGSGSWELVVRRRSPPELYIHIHVSFSSPRLSHPWFSPWPSILPFHSPLPFSLAFHSPLPFSLPLGYVSCTHLRVVLADPIHSLTLRFMLHSAMGCSRSLASNAILSAANNLP